jgi:HK97 family phage major capsid protein
MSRVRITQLREERHAAYERMKEINDLQEAEQRDLTGEESQEYDRLEQRLEQIEPEVRRLERAEGLEQRLAGNPRPADVTPAEERELPKTWGEFAARRAQDRTVASDEYREAWFNLMSRGGDDSRLSPEHRAILERGNAEQRALSAITGSEGAYTVPVSTYNQIIEKLLFFSQLRQIATVLPTATGVDLKIPLEADIGTGGWEAENTAYTESDVALGVVTLKAWKYTRIIKIPKELIQDSIVDIEAYVARAFGRSFGLGEQAAYVNGDGSGKPTGYVSQATVGETVAHAASITADNIIDLYYSVSPPYRFNAQFVANDILVKTIRKFKDSQGRYLWEMNLQAGQPDMLLGKPVYSDPFIDAPSTSSTAASPMTFGDHSYVWIRDVAGVTMQRLVELYAAQGQIGFLMDHRSDSTLTQTDAVKTLVTTAV